jgi:hypothetical protein
MQNNFMTFLIKFVKNNIYTYFIHHFIIFYDYILYYITNIMKVLIITDERTGGTSFYNICGIMIDGLHIDDINTHFNKFKNKDIKSWVYKYDIKHNIGITSYFDKYDTFADVDIYNMITFLFNNGIDVFKLSINDSFWTNKQTENLVNSLNTNNNDFLIIKLIRQNNFNKILSKCIAFTLFDKIGDQAYDVKMQKYNISINEKVFIYICKTKLNTHKIINSICIPNNNIFVYESFYKDINEVTRLKKLLNVSTIVDKHLFNNHLFDRHLCDKHFFDTHLFDTQLFDKHLFDKHLFDKQLFDKQSFAENYYKDYKSENVTVTNLSELKQIFDTSFYH